jgi:hypothetical protein
VQRLIACGRVAETIHFAPGVHLRSASPCLTRSMR